MIKKTSFLFVSLVALVSADLVSGLASPVHAATLAGANVATTAVRPARNLIIIDATVTEPDTFAARNALDRVVRIEAGDDALQDLADILASDGTFDRVHIVSHGMDGAIFLGGRRIDRAALLQRPDTLRIIGNALPRGAGIQLYGCDVASSAHGQQFVQELSGLLDRPVMASADATGGIAAGGDWDLEYATGRLRASNPFGTNALKNYADTLSHFRGGSVSWQTAALDGDGVRDDVTITVKTAWRASSVNSVTGLGSTPALTITQVSENVIFVGGADAASADYALETTILEARNLDPETHYLVNYSGGNRIAGLQNNSNGFWNIQSTIYMSDQNLAPKIDLPIIIEVPQFQSDGVTALTNWTYDIGSSDPNADKLRYRLANISELGDNGQTNPAGLSINPNTGLLTWTGSGSRTLGLYSGGVVAEDVDELGNPKSKSHVDFILDLRATAAVDFSYSSDIPETRNIRVEKGTTYAFAISGTLIETTSLGDVQGALAEVTEGNFVFDPGPDGAGLDPATYPITFEVADGADLRSNSYLTLNFIVPDPDAPSIANLEGDRTVYNSTVSQLVDEDVDAVVADVDNTHFNGGRLKFNVTFTDGQFEILAIESVGDGAGQIRVSGSDIFYEGNAIGTIGESLDGIGTALAIAFTSDNATVAAVQALIRSLTYEDTFVLRSAGDRALSLFMEDPEGHTASYDFFIDVEAHPSAPPPGGGPIEAANELTIVEGATVSISDENLNYADPDAGDTVTLTVSNVTNGQFELVSAAGDPVTSFTQEQVTLGQIAFAHDGSELAPAYDVSASDGTNPATAPSAATISFSNVADQAPSISGTPDTVVTENAAYSFTPVATDDDVGTGSTLTYSIVNQPAWATFSTATGTLSGTPGSADVGNHNNITITVTDDGGLDDSLPPFSIQVLINPDIDGDGVPDSQEVIDGTDADDADSFKDTDGDGVPDYVEVNVYGTDPSTPDAADTDGDGVPDYVETYIEGTDPNDASDAADTDGDGVPDYVESNTHGTDPGDASDYQDTDGDGVPDYVEVNTDGTDPADASDASDTDGDGVPDYVETQVYGSDPATPDAADTDGDGVPDYTETYSEGTNPDDSSDFSDMDGDGVPDHVEVNTDSTDPDDATDYRDTDGDGVPDYVEANSDGTDPNDADDYKDTDGDGVPDYVEVNVHDSDPDDADSFADSDNDGVPDYVETAVYGTDPQTADAGDTDGDGVPDYTETYADGSDPDDAESYQDSDGDRVPDYVETNVDDTDPADATNYADSDGDGVPDYVEVHIDGSDADDAADFVDTDGDGVSDYQEGQDGTDPLDPNSAPVVVATVDATGLYTKVTLGQLAELGLIDSADSAACCGNYRRSAADGEPMFPPGRHRIEWAAPGVNVLVVRPIISAGQGVSVTEGQIASFSLYLNGLSAEYPLVVPYSISGTTDSADHDLQPAGAAVFQAGETRATVTFMVLEDGLDEGPESIVVTLDDEELNIGPRNVQTIQVVDGNLPARIDLDVMQGAQSTLTVSQAGGPVTVASLVTDPNVGDTHTYAWSTAAGGPVDTDGDDSTLTFDPATLAEGIYSVYLTVSDNGEPATSVKKAVRIRVVANLVALGADDSDGDGVNDLDEGYRDADQDGIPDWIDANPAANVMQETAAEPQSFLIECDAGVVCRLGTMALGGETGGALLAAAGIASNSALVDDIDYANAGGIFDVEIDSGIAGEELRIVLPQRVPVPVGAMFRVSESGSNWGNFVTDSANGIYSARGEAGACPPPGDASYSPGLSAGDWCVLVILEQGGPNDTNNDGTSSAAITGGVGAPTEIVYRTTSSGGGASSPLTVLLLALGLVAISLRRRALHIPARSIAACLLAVTATVTLAVPHAAMAQSQPDSAGGKWWNSMFVSANFGTATTDTSVGELERDFANAGIAADIASLDKRRTGWGFGVGYPLTPAWSLELGYQDLDEVDIVFRALSTSDDLSDVRPESGEGVTLSGAYRYALADALGLQARVGLFRWNSDHATHRIDTQELVDKSSASGTDLYWGIGAYWRVNKPLSVDLEYQRYEFDRQPAGYFRAGLRWSFGR